MKKVKLGICLAMLAAFVLAIGVFAQSTAYQTVSFDYYSSAAIKSDGSLWVWEGNDFGQLGDGTNKNKNKPVKILDNIMLPSGNVTFTPVEENKEFNPTLSPDSADVVIKLGEQKWIDGYIDGINKQISCEGFTVKSNNESIVRIIDTSFYCGSISNRIQSIR